MDFCAALAPAYQKFRLRFAIILKKFLNFKFNKIFMFLRAKDHHQKVLLRKYGHALVIFKLNFKF
jgi:hypothetical protein